MSSQVEKVSAALYTTGCIKFGSFTLKSGTVSPYYIDIAQLLSSPTEMFMVASAIASELKALHERVDKLASIELKGALLLPLVAYQAKLPGIVVRKGEKTYGVKGRIAGTDVVEGDTVVLIDDVVSEGNSKIEAFKILEGLGARVKHLFVVVDREQGGAQLLEKMGYKVHALARVSEVVRALRCLEKINREQEKTVLQYVQAYCQHE
jgi:uridine monophosphate synthetase